jgi:hypothetical protein
MSMTRSLTASLAAGLLALTIAGCGDSAPTAPVDPLLQFLGVWHYDTADGKNSCPGFDPVDVTPAGNKRIGRGVDHALVDLSVTTLDREASCDFGFDVDGLVATAPVGQGCALRGGSLETLTRWTLTLTSPTTMEEIATADDPLTLNMMPVTCKFTLMAELTRVSKD